MEMTLKKQEDFENLYMENYRLQLLVTELTQEVVEFRKKSQQQKLSDMLFSEWLDVWLNEKRHSVKHNTFDCYSVNVTVHIRPYFARLNLSLSEITPKVLDQFFEYQVHFGLSKATIAKQHSIIHSALSMAIMEQRISTNSADYVKISCNEQKQSGTFLTVSQLKELLASLDGHKLYLPVVLGAVMGLRRSEIVGLRWRDVNADNHTISICHTVTKYCDNHRVQLDFSESTKSVSSKRTLPLPNFVFCALQKTFLLQEKRKRKNMSYNTKYHDYVCVDENGNLLTPDYISKTFRRKADKLGLTSCRFHDLRHTCASLLCQNGVSMRYISEWLGHSNTAVTDKVYVHLSFSDKLPVAEKLENLME